MIARTGPQISRMLRFVGGTLLLLLPFDLLVAVSYVCFGQHWLALPNLPLSIGSGAIGVVLGFRNSSSYGRWWEARTLWGRIAAYSRSVGRQAVAYISDSDERQDHLQVEDVRRRIVYYQIAYINALRCQLRGQDPRLELTPFLDKEEIDSLHRATNVAAEIQRRMAALLQHSCRRGWLGEVHLALFDQSLTELAASQGGCERIKHTPVPKQYDYFLKLVVQGQCILLPLGMVASLGLLTPIGASLLGFIFLALEKFGRDLEHPFDHSDHDVALTSICRTVEIDLKQYLGDAKLPATIAPVQGVLW